MVIFVSKTLQDNLRPTNLVICRIFNIVFTIIIQLATLIDRALQDLKSSIEIDTVN
jgi:hypothetical protein